MRATFGIANAVKAFKAMEELDQPFKLAAMA
jgi:hypothetical protein